MGQKFHFSEIWSTSIIWPWCAAVTADTARPVLQASVTLCCCVYDTSERLFSIHIILAYGNVPEGWSPLEFKRSTVRKCIPYPTKILVIFTDVTDSLSTVSKYFKMTMWSLGCRNPKANLICIYYLFGCLNCTLIFPLCHSKTILIWKGRLYCVKIDTTKMSFLR